MGVKNARITPQKKINRNIAEKAEGKTKKVAANPAEPTVKPTADPAPNPNN